MARTAQTARKSVGGRPPRKQLQLGANHAHQDTFVDHTGQSYTVVGGRSFPGSGLKKLGIQLYCLGQPTPSPEVLGEKFVSCAAIRDWGNARNWWPRVDVYTCCTTVAECVEHHRQEKAFRAKAIEEMRMNAVKDLPPDAAERKLRTEIRGQEPLPHIVPAWCPGSRFWTPHNYGSRYKSWILVMPPGCLSWDDVLKNGLLCVQSDPDVTAEMETESYDLDSVDDEPSLLDEGSEGKWVFVEKTGIDMSMNPSRQRLLCVREQPQGLILHPEDTSNVEKVREYFDGWKTPGHEGTLFHMWSEMTTSLWDCTYRPVECEGCYTGEDHAACEVELDEHYFDVDGQCVGCRRQERE